MGKRRSIFERLRLRPGQLRSVAERRFADALYLRQSNHNERANGAMYLAGFVIECLLKAHLLDRFPWLQSAGASFGLPRDKQHIWSLCYRSHDLDEILARLPEVVDRLALVEQRGQLRLVQMLKGICAEWTIFARYSPRSATMAEAEEFLLRVRELKQWLR